MNAADWKLIDRYLCGEISEEELAELQERLRSRPELRAAFRQAASLDMALTDLASIDPESSRLLMLNPNQQPVSAPGAPAWAGSRWLGMAALFALFFGGLLWMNSRPDSNGTPPIAGPMTAPSAEVGSILRLEKCVSKNKGASWQEGGRLTTGEIEIESGTMVFGLDDGPRIVLEGPAHLTLQTSEAAFLHFGYMSFENFFEGQTFEVRTPYSVLVDIGTEYSVEVGKKGEAIRVHGGEVWRTDRQSANDISFIGEGETAIFGELDDGPSWIAKLERERMPLLEESSVSRTPWARDPFDYPGEPGASVESADKGLGWKSPWRGLTRNLAMEESGRDTLVLSDGLEFGPHFVEPGKSVVLSGNSTMHRRMAHPIRRDKDGTYYFSVLLQADAPASTPGTPSSLFVNFRNSDSLSKDNADRLMAGIYKGRMLLCRNGGSERRHVSVDTGSPCLFVGKITMREHGKDQIQLDILDSPGNLDREPVWPLRRTGTTSEDPLNTIILHVIGDAPVHVSEVRIGKSWESVTH